MAIVVNDGNPTDHTGAGEAALDTGKALEPGADRLGRHVQLIGHGNGSRGIERIVHARHGQFEPIDTQLRHADAVADFDRKMAHAINGFEIHQPHIGLRVLAIGDDPAILDLADQGLHFGMIQTHHRKADDAAIDHRRIEIARIEQRGHQRCGGGLAMGATNGNGGLETHDLGQHLGPAHDRQLAGTCRHQFRIVALDS